MFYDWHGHCQHQCECLKRKRRSFRYFTGTAGCLQRDGSRLVWRLLIRLTHHWSMWSATPPLISPSCCLRILRFWRRGLFQLITILCVSGLPAKLRPTFLKSHSFHNFSVGLRRNSEPQRSWELCGFIDLYLLYDNDELDGDLLKPPEHSVPAMSQLR